MKKLLTVITSIFVASFIAAGVAFVPVHQAKADEIIVVTDETPEQLGSPPLTPEVSSGFISKYGAELKEHLKARDEEFTIYVSGSGPVDGDEVSSIMNAIKTEAYKHTGDPSEGDYFRWSVKRIQTSISFGSEINYLKYTVEYNSSKSQDAQAEEKADQIIASLNLSGKNDYEKIRAIYDYMTANTTYDYDGLYSDDPLAHSCYAALCKNTSVCQGISLAIYKLMLKAGIDCRIVSGYLNGGAHGWNIVRLGGKYYFVDATNDLGKQDYRYFLVCEGSMPIHVLDDEYKTSDYVSKHPYASSDFDYSSYDPSTDPTVKPTSKPTSKPTAKPTSKPTAKPTAKPTSKPTSKPTAEPTSKPTARPTVKPNTKPLPSQSKFYLKCGQTAYPNATVGDKPIKTTSWKSSDPSIAYFKDDGGLVAKAAGTVTLSYVYSGKTYYYGVTILYKDVTSKKDFWYAPTNYLTAIDVVKGYEKQTKFKPGNKCTRAQMVTFMWRLQGSPEPASKSCNFTDVKKSAYYYKPVLWAVENGITTGYKGGKFKPNNVCTRAQTVTFLYRLAGQPPIGSANNPFKDVKKSDYFYKAVIWASDKQIVAGYKDKTFRPSGKCLRRQMVTFLYKYDKYINGRG